MADHTGAITALTIGIAVGTRASVHDFARAKPGAFGRAFHIRIGVCRNVRAGARGDAGLGDDARLARPGTTIVTTNAVLNGAASADALAVLRARSDAIDELASACAVAIRGAGAFTFGVGIGQNERAGAVDAAGFRRAASLAGSGARRAATNTVDAEAAVALRIRHASGAIGEFARSRAVAFIGRAFIIGIGICGDRTARTARRARFRHAASLARPGARRIAAEAVDAAVADALCRLRTGRTIACFTGAGAIAFSAHAFIVRIVVRRNERTRSIHAARLGRAACFTCPVARGAAAETVDAEIAQAFRIDRTSIARGLLARTRRIANGSGRAKVLLSDEVGRANTGNLITRLARPVARRIAANAVDAIAALALRIRHANRTVRGFASADAIAFGRAFVVRVGIRSDIAAHTVRAAGLGRTARFARAGARVFATHAVDAEVARAFRISAARIAVGRFRARSDAVAQRRAYAFVIGIGIRENRRARPVGLTRLGIAASFARTETRIFATDEIDTSLAEAFIVRRTRLTVRIDALARAVTHLQTEARRRVVRLLRRNVGTRADAAGDRTRLAFTGATIVATHAVHAETERALIVSSAQAALHQFRRAHVHEQIAVIVARALRIVRARAQAGARITRERAAAHIAAVDANTRAVARIRIDLGIARARRSLTNGAVGVERASAGTIACTGFTARTRGLLIAFVLRVLTIDDRPALAIDTAALQHARAGLAQARTNRVTTHAVDTEAAGALIGRRT